jgi:uncharacterized protein YpuA (DUF1002 family)
MGDISDTLDDGSGIEPGRDERVRGLVDQVKADYATGNQPGDARGLLEQRLQQTGLDLPPDQVDSLVREIEDGRS